MITQKELLRHNKILVDLAIDFYLSKAINIPHFEEIVKTLESIQNPNEKDKNRIKLGLFTVNDFMMFVTEKKIIQGGISMRIVEVVVELLENNLLLQKQYNFGQNLPATYMASVDYVKLVYSYGLVNNILFGFNYIIENYSNSVVMIENIDKNKDAGIGTGFVIKRKNSDYVVTNAHNIEGAEVINIYDSQNNPIQFKLVKSDPEKDIAVLEIEKPPTIFNFFRFNEKYKILSEIITIGYPKIPLTKAAYQVCHKGEVNSNVEDYFGNNLFLISAKTSSGNSGSPVIDSSGLVIGMVTKELFEKEEFKEKGKLPYIAVIPSPVINTFLNEIGLDNSNGVF